MYTCKLSGDHRVNLAQIRCLQFEEPPLVVMVIWANGDRSIYRGTDAFILLEAWDEADDARKSLFQRMNTPDELETTPSETPRA